ncbi:MAG: hypothetical protein HY321_09750 [Armatimonadetes bacterium]|nr:hypothetical protein [Armatimonadota bacterium]
MNWKGRTTRGGMTVVEVLIATAIALLVAGVVTQVLVLTVRTTNQTSVQADQQSSARVALRDWEHQLRDGWAVLTTYTMQSGPNAGTVYNTQITDTSQTVIAAVPSLDGSGVPCSWRGQSVIFDCLIWHATRQADDTWDLQRLTVPNAFQMPLTFFALRVRERPSLLGWLITPALAKKPDGSTPPGTTDPPPGTPSGTSYTPPTSFARTAELSPVTLFAGASTLDIKLLSGVGSVLAAIGGAGAPAAVATAQPLPVWIDSTGNRLTTPVTVTDVANLRISLEFSGAAATLESGRGETTLADTQATTIRLRNRQSW